MKIGPLEGGIRVRRSKKLILTIATISCSLILAVIPMVGQVSPAQAVNPPWTKYAGGVTLEVTPDNNEKYVIDAWVVRDGSIYRMWYTHVKTDLGITELVDSLVTSGFGDIIDDIGNMNPDDLVDHLVALDIDEIVDVMGGTSTVIGYATSTPKPFRETVVPCGIVLAPPASSRTAIPTRCGTPGSKQTLPGQTLRTS